MIFTDIKEDMSFLDSYVVQMRDFVNSFSQEVPTTDVVVDQSKIWYKLREAGPDYQAPFAIANVARCPGNATDIEGEEPFDYWLAIIDEVKPYDVEWGRDRSEFLTWDFPNYDLTGEVIADPLFFGNQAQRKEITNFTKLRKYTYLKRIC